MKKTKVNLNKPVYLGLISILEISKPLMYEFWSDYIKSKVSAKSKFMLHCN